MAEKMERKPELRFKGFDGEWTTSAMRDLCDTFTDGDWIEAKDQSSSGVRLIQTGNVGVAGFLDKPDTKKWISYETFVKLNCEEVYPGDILISRLPDPAGRACVVPDLDGRLITAVDCTIVRPSEKCYNKYLVQYLSTKTYFHNINNLLAGGTRQRVSRGNLAKLTISHPNNISEQKIIGNCLETLDSLITTHQHKSNQLQNLKKAMLEKMFPREGADVPEVRFKGFEGAWVTSILGDSIVEHTDRTSDFEIYPLYSLTIEDGVTPKTQRYERGFLVQKEADLFKIVPLNSFVSNPMNLRFGAIGYNTSEKVVSVSGYYDVFSLDGGKCSDFWNTYLRTPQALKKYDDVATGSLIEKRRVHFSELKKLTFLVPENFEEKKKIGRYFQNLDALISHQQKKIEHLKHLKSALLEKMFVSEKAS